MNLRRVLRALITLEIVFLAVSVLVSYYTESSPPYVLNVYGAAHPLLAEGHLAPLGILAVALCLGLVVSWIGLWRHWNPARYLYLGAQAGMVGVDASLGTPVDSVSTTSLAMYILLTLIIGAIFALIFLSELRREFERKALP